MNDSRNGLQPPEIGASPEADSARGRWWVHLIILGAYPLVVGFLGWNRAEGSAPALTGTPKGLLLTCLIQLGIFGGIFLLGWLASRASPDDLLLRWRGGFWPIPLGLAYSVGLRLGLGIVALMVFTGLLATGMITTEQARDFTQANRPDVGAMVDIGALRSDPLYFWLTVSLVSFVVAGLREELWRSAVLAGCGRLWPQWFSSRGGQVGAVALISVVFGLGHVSMGPIAVVAASLLGLGLGGIMVLHRSIWPAVIAHGMFDATTFALLPWVIEALPKT